MPQDSRLQDGGLLPVQPADGKKSRQKRRQKNFRRQVSIPASGSFTLH